MYINQYICQDTNELDPPPVRTDVDPASPGSPARLVGPRQPRGSTGRQAGRQANHQACTQTGLADMALHQQAQPSQARHGMAYGIPRHNTQQNWIFQKIPLHHHNSAAAPREVTFYGCMIRAREKLPPPNLRDFGKTPFLYTIVLVLGNPDCSNCWKQNISKSISN